MMKSKFTFFIGGIVLLMLLFLSFYKIPVLKLQYQDHILFFNESSFEIGWIHSVEKEPWFETYTLCGDELCLLKTRFKTFGAGVPSNGDIIPSDDGYIWMKLNQKISELRLSVSKNIETTLYLNNEQIKLYELVDDYDTVLIKSETIPLWKYLRR